HLRRGQEHRLEGRGPSPVADLQVPFPRHPFHRGGRPPHPSFPGTSTSLPPMVAVPIRRLHRGQGPRSGGRTGPPDRSTALCPFAHGGRPVAAVRGKSPATFRASGEPPGGGGNTRRGRVRVPCGWGFDT